MHSCFFANHLNDPLYSGANQRYRSVNRYRKGDYLFYEGNRPSGIYCLNQGKIKLSKTNRDGKELIVKIFNPGDLVGYSSFFTGENYTATAEALEESEVCFMERDKFMEIIRQKPVLVSKLLKIMGYDIKTAESKTVSMAYKSNNERFVDVILDLNKKYGVKDGLDFKIDISLSRHDLASLTGTSVETIVRVLAWLKEKGAVKTHKKYIYISDLQVLQEMAPEY